MNTENNRQQGGYIVARYAKALREFQDANKAMNEAVAKCGEARTAMNTAWSSVQTAVAVGTVAVGMYRVGHAYRPEGRSEHGVRIAKSDMPAEVEPMYEACQP